MFCAIDEKGKICNYYIIGKKYKHNFISQSQWNS